MGREGLSDQREAFKKILFRDYSSLVELPRMIKSVAIAGRGIARQGVKIYKDDKSVPSLWAH